MKRIGWAVPLAVPAAGSAHHSVGTLFDRDATIEIVPFFYGLNKFLHHVR